VAHVELSAQVLLEEHRFLPLSVITGSGSRQRFIFVAERSNDEKQATPGASLEQQALG